jgi:hypothetical protein
MWPHWVALRRYFGGALGGLGETAGVGAFDTGFPVDREPRNVINQTEPEPPEFALLAVSKTLMTDSLEKTMSVQITPKSTQHTGMATSTEGSVAAWQVTFQLDGDEFLHAAISVSVAGPSTHQEAQQKALKLLQVFLSDACEAAKKYQFSN